MTECKKKALLTVAVALLSACKSSPPATGYLCIDDDSVLFVEWTQLQGRQIKGSIDVFVRTESGQFESALILFDGTLDKEDITLTYSDSASSTAKTTFTGSLKGDVLMFDPNLRGPVECHRATHEQKFDARQNLIWRTQAEKRKGAQAK